MFRLVWVAAGTVTRVVVEGDAQSDLDLPAGDADLFDDEAHEALTVLEVEVKGATISIRTLSGHSAPPAGIIGRGLCSRVPRALPRPGAHGRVLALMASSQRRDKDKDLELVVLLHQVRILERQLHCRVQYRRADRALLAALSRLLPRVQWRAFLVTPGTAPLAPRGRTAKVADVATAAMPGPPTSVTAPARQPR